MRAFCAAVNANPLVAAATALSFVEVEGDSVPEQPVIPAATANAARNLFRIVLSDCG
jgi:hypothetical protein